MLKVGGLFSGIGGFELGLERNGYETSFFCEILPEAKRVLNTHFEGIPIFDDITVLKKIPEVDVLTAGFPCQDLSIAGTKTGINGQNSSRVDHLFRLLKDQVNSKPKWLLIENVAYMLSLDKGKAMWHLVKQIEGLGYRWAYRVLDARSLGVKQRRLRVIFAASRVAHPKHALFNEDIGRNPFDDSVSRIENDANYGFYWTEGFRGIGWAKEAIPPIKGGSGLGIPSPPAVWNSSHDFFGTPSIQDAEIFQGFPAEWTAPIEEDGEFKQRHRWKLVGNAMCVPMSNWVGQAIRKPTELSDTATAWDSNGGAWPKAAFGEGGRIYQVGATPWLFEPNCGSLSDSLLNPLKPLSHRAAAGFYNRACRSQNVVYSKKFMMSIEKYMRMTSP